LQSIGCANDAEDHGYLEDARRMREQACEDILSLLEEQVFLSKLFPTLEMEVKSGHILGFGWANLHTKVLEKISQIENGYNQSSIKNEKNP
jgi:hypothetical protein